MTNIWQATRSELLVRNNKQKSIMCLTKPDCFSLHLNVYLSPTPCDCSEGKRGQENKRERCKFGQRTNTNPHDCIVNDKPPLVNYLPFQKIQLI